GRNGPKSARIGVGMDQKVRMILRHTALFSGDSARFAPHQTPPNPTGVVGGWVAYERHPHHPRIRTAMLGLVSGTDTGAARLAHRNPSPPRRLYPFCPTRRVPLPPPQPSQDRRTRGQSPV